MLRFSSLEMLYFSRKPASKVIFCFETTIALNKQGYQARDTDMFFHH